MTDQKINQKLNQQSGQSLSQQSNQSLGQKPSHKLKNISVIIPVWKQETELKKLLSDLEFFGAEIIQSSEGSRAKSLNTGASKASREFLWFLHADSRINQHNVDTLLQSIDKYPKAVHYFELIFENAGLSAWNASWANLRSSWFKLPYGDQGLCVSKIQFERIGIYPEDAPYGEDLLFIRKAKKINIDIISTRSKIISSARKYHTQGWLKTTLSHWAIMFELLRKKI